MITESLSAPAAAPGKSGRRSTLRRRLGERWWMPSPGAITALLLVLLGVAFVLATGVRPAYDAYGWLVWGRQAAHLHLDTNAAPSWKPLTFLFTFPYALVVGRAALWLWMVTSATAGFAAAAFGGLAAYRLNAPPADRSKLPALIAGGLAGAGVLGIAGYWHFMLISTADPLMVALSLGAVYWTVAKRYLLAWIFIVGLCLGRPEALPVVVAFAGWAWLRQPGMRIPVTAGLGLIPLLWFGIPALTSHSWLIAGDVLGGSTSPLPGNKITAVLRGFVSLYELPMQVAVLIALAVGILARKRAWLLIALAATSWLIMDIALAAHGWGIAPRYMFEPAAAAVVVAAAAAGAALSAPPRRLMLIRVAAAALVIALVVTLAPTARVRARLAHNGIVLGRTWAKQIHRLHTLIAREGGPKRILQCGQAVTTVPYQSILAWELDENVIDVGWIPEAWERVAQVMGLPIVLFQPVGAGWRMHTEGRLLVSASSHCPRLAGETPTSR